MDVYGTSEVTFFCSAEYLVCTWLIQKPILRYDLLSKSMNSNSYIHLIKNITFFWFSYSVFIYEEERKNNIQENNCRLLLYTYLYMFFSQWSSMNILIWHYICMYTQRREERHIEISIECVEVNLWLDICPKDIHSTYQAMVHWLSVLVVNILFLSSIYYYSLNLNYVHGFSCQRHKFQYLPVASALLIGGLTVTTITLNQGIWVLLFIFPFSFWWPFKFCYWPLWFSMFSGLAGRNTQHYLSSILCAGLTAGMVAIVKSNGRQICSRPRLCGLL